MIFIVCWLLREAVTASERALVERPVCAIERGYCSSSWGSYCGSKS
jgi:hypothetical protein